MTPEVMDRITKYVMSCPDLKNIKITWFGGEPLMAVPQIEEFYDKFSAVWEKPINSNIITTGYHINEEAVRVMKKVHYLITKNGPNLSSIWHIEDLIPLLSVIRNLFSTNVQFATKWRSHLIRKDMHISVGR